MPKKPIFIRYTNICSLPLGIELGEYDYRILSNLGGEEYNYLRQHLSFLDNKKHNQCGKALDILKENEAKIDSLKKNYDVWILPYLASKGLEELCNMNGWKKAFNSFELAYRLEKKDELQNLFGDTDFLVPSKNYTFLEADYKELQKKWGNKFVAQYVPQNADMQPSGGKSTFFIESEDDYSEFKKSISQDDVVRISQFVVGDSCFMNGSISAKGKVYFTGIFRQMIGVPELASSAEIYVGFDCGGVVDYSPKIKEQARIIMQTVGEKLSKQGYKGYFGIDLILDEEEENVYLIEINPRFVGSTGIVNYLHAINSQFSLFNCHINAFLGAQNNVDSTEENLGLGADFQGANLVMRFDSEKQAVVKKSPNTGVYRLCEGGLEFVREGWNPKDLKTENEVLVSAVLPEEYSVAPQERMANLFSFAKVSESSYVLSESFQKAVEWVRREFIFE